MCFPYLQRGKRLVASAVIGVIKGIVHRRTKYFSAMSMMGMSMMTRIDGSETMTFNVMPVADRGRWRRRATRAARSSTGTAGRGRAVGRVRGRRRATTRRDVRNRVGYRQRCSGLCDTTILIRIPQCDVSSLRVSRVKFFFYFTCTCSCGRGWLVVCTLREWSVGINGVVSSFVGVGGATLDGPGWTLMKREI